MEWRKDSYTVSDERSRLDRNAVFELLSQTYWAANRSRGQIGRAIDNSVCVGLYEGERQIGFARAVTDYATFSWLCDVVVHPGCRGRGLGKWMVACLLEHPALQGTNLLLGTRDAHGLYARFGFERREMMVRRAAAQT